MIFYDERIEAAKGRTIRRATAIAVVMSLLSFAFHLANILKNSEGGRWYWLASLEGTIAALGLFCLVCDAIRTKLTAQDERGLTERAHFFNRAGRWLLRSLLGAYAVLLPIVISIDYHPKYFSDSGFDPILYDLLFVVGLYVIYCFKRDDIYFNYSLMESGHYRRGVWRHIGKLALYTAGAAGVSLSLYLVIAALDGLKDTAFLTAKLIDILTVYLTYLVQAILFYLLCSLLEKVSYGSRRTISGASILTLFLTILLHTLWSAFVIWIDTIPIKPTKAAELLTRISNLGPYITLALLVFLLYFYHEYQKRQSNRGVAVACRTILIAQIAGGLCGRLCTKLIILFTPEILRSEPHIIGELFSTVTLTVDGLTAIAVYVGVVLLIAALVRDHVLSPAHFGVIGAIVLHIGLEIFLRTQVSFLEIAIYKAIVETVMLVYLGIVTVFVGHKLGNLPEDT